MPKSAYDIAVIGRGLMGTAAAKYSAQAGANTLLIGETEPRDLKNHPGVYASHYDSGRITRVLDPDALWAKLARESIQRYRQLEQSSGINFYHPVGCLYAGSEDDPYMKRLRQTRTTVDTESEILDTETFITRFPHIQLGPGVQTVFEAAPAGYIDPRNMVAAQAKACELNGATLKQQVAQSISQQQDTVKIITHTESFFAKQVIVAAGSFTNELLAKPLRYKIEPRTVAMGWLSADQAASLPQLPSLISMDTKPPIDYYYMLPQVRYPDGSIRIKMGCFYLEAQTISSPESLRNWFKGVGDAQEIELLKTALAKFLPDIKFERITTAPCVYTATATGYPYLGQIGEHVFVATGGCGTAAKSADEMGRIIATWALNGKCPAPYRQDQFKLQYSI